MARVTVEDCLTLIPNRFALVLLATKRTRQIMSGARTIVEKKNKDPVIALREIATGKVRPDRNIRDVLSGKYDKAKEKSVTLRPMSQSGPRNIFSS